MNQFNDTTELRAEVLLQQLYPDMAEKWIVETRGTFYRNYSSDMLHADANTSVVSLTRNGLYHLLPPAIITPQDEYKKHDFKRKNKEINSRNEEIGELFRPFDTYWFRKSIKVEQQVAQAVEQKLAFILEKYFGCDLKAAPNAYVRQLMTLLPNVAHLRGDLAKIKHLLAALFGAQVEMKVSYVDGGIPQVEPQQQVVFRVYVEQLSQTQYTAMYQQVKPVEEFLEEWFIPAYMQVKIVLRSHANSVLNAKTLLNYNAKI
jgi:hypothetical protein